MSPIPTSWMLPLVCGCLLVYTEDNRHKVRYPQNGVGYRGLSNQDPTLEKMSTFRVSNQRWSVQVCQETQNPNSECIPHRIDWCPAILCINMLRNPRILREGGNLMQGTPETLHPIDPTNYHQVPNEEYLSGLSYWCFRGVIGSA